MLVSLGIIVVLSGMMLANFHGGQQASELRLAADVSVTQARAVQTSALSGALVQVCSGGPSNLQVCDNSSKQPPVLCGTGGICQARAVPGYGMRFTAQSKTFLVFYDANGNGRFDAGEDLTTKPYVQTGTVTLDSANVPLPLDLVFQAPNGQMTFNGVTNPDEADLVLKHTATGSTRTLKLYRVTGKIEHD
jgi:type II secretory pathway pseudopilin PulG